MSDFSYTSRGPLSANRIISSTYLLARLLDIENGRTGDGSEACTRKEAKRRGKETVGSSSERGQLQAYPMVATSFLATIGFWTHPSAGGKKGAGWIFHRQAMAPVGKVYRVRCVLWWGGGGNVYGW